MRYAKFIFGVCMNTEIIIGEIAQLCPRFLEDRGVLYCTVCWIVLLYMSCGSSSGFISESKMTQRKESH